MGVKMLFRSSRPSVRGAGRVVKSYGVVEGKWYALFTFILILRIKHAQRQGRTGAGLPCYSAARGIPAEGICTYVDVSLELAGYIHVHNAGTAAARLFKALHHEAVIEACDL